MERPGALPNFLIIGAARCGTTNFASYLRVQPGVFLAAKRPEPHYFLKDWEYEKGIGYYSDRRVLDLGGFEVSYAPGDRTGARFVDLVMISTAAVVG